MGVSFLVTISAIIEYLRKAREAQEKLNEATERMNRAAQDLCSKWQGDAAAAFAQEQQVLYGYCRQLHEVGNEYIVAVEKQAAKYEQAEIEVQNAIAGKG